jgi:hypothetical protein
LGFLFCGGVISCFSGFVVIFGIKVGAFRCGLVVTFGILFEFPIGLQLLLHGFLHADSIHHQFEMLEDLGFVAVDVAFDGIFAEQLGQVAFGHDQVQEI